ncbi:apoptosis inhibitory protein 5-domain-containing protein, partial [Globomyces pollinis-pini]
MLVDQQIGKQFYDATNDLLDMKINQADPSLYTNQFNLLLESPRWTGENGLKILAAKCIPQYLSYFPTLQENALDTHLDFCEDDDIQVRVESIKNLGYFSNISPLFALRIADVLVQLLQSDITDEYNVVKQSLLHSFQKHPKDSSDAMFYQITNGPANVRDVACKFISNELLTKLSPALKLKYFLRFLTSMNHFEPSEICFETIMDLLPVDLPLANNSDNCEMLEILCLKRLESIASNPDEFIAKKVIQIAKCNIQLFDLGYSSTSFINILIEHILKQSSSVLNSNVAKEVHIFRVLADLLPHAKFTENELKSIILWLSNELIQLEDSLMNHEKIPNRSLCKIEPILYCILYSRIKGLIHDCTNTSDLKNILQKVFVASQNTSDYLYKHLKTLNPTSPDYVRHERLLSNAKMTHEYTKELLKESRFSKILKSPSWAQSQSTPIVIVDPVIEPKGTPPMTSKPTKKKAKRPHSAPQAKTSPIIAVTKPVAKPVAKKSKKASKITPKTATAQTAPVSVEIKIDENLHKIKPSRKKTNQISLQGLKSAKILLIRERSEFIPNPNSSSRLSVKPLDNVRPPTTRQ